MFDLSYYNKKKVLITGHTGFKGSWMSVVLANAGAEVVGCSTCTDKGTRLFELCGIKSQIKHIKADVRDLDVLLDIFEENQPEIVIHMAAQPIVRDGYKDPVKTYSTNVMGTVNICEAVRQTDSVKSFLNVTTDKVYDNKEDNRSFVESDPLDGYDPYSNSKSCSELVTHCYTRSFLKDCSVAVSTARAGNVIGGGDFANDRIIPDCVRAVIAEDNIVVRNPNSIRPYQHVLEPIYAYLMIAAMQCEDNKYSSWYNIGPDTSDCIKTGDLVDLFVRQWGNNANWVSTNDQGPHEANYLQLDSSLIKQVIGWKPQWDIETAVEKTVDWYKTWNKGEDVRAVMDRQIEEYSFGR